MGLFGDLPPWRGWYEAIEDLLPGLEERSLAKWQLERVPKEIREALLVASGNAENSQTVRERDDPAWCVTSGTALNSRAILLDCKNGARSIDAGGPTMKTGADPCFTIGADSVGTHCPTAMIGTRVVRISARCLGRFQSVPDWYVLPDNKKLASTIIGNGVPCLLAQRIGESFLGS
jgi:site-specific DNA-cytosine methylase